jgi:hypothetical protein
MRTLSVSAKTNRFTQCLPSRSPALVPRTKFCARIFDRHFFCLNAFILFFFGLSYSLFRTLSLGHIGKSGMDTSRGKAGCFWFRRGASGRFLTFHAILGCILSFFTLTFYIRESGAVLCFLCFSFDTRLVLCVTLALDGVFSFHF